MGVLAIVGGDSENARERAWRITALNHPRRHMEPGVNAGPKTGCAGKEA